LTKTGKVKLGDLNVSKIAKKGLLYTQTGTPYYASPEVWKDMPYDSKSDIWSLGCVLYEAITLKPPFTAKSMEGLNQKVQKGFFAKIPSIYSEDLWEVIKLMMQVNPKNRPSCGELLSNPIILKHSQEFEQDEEQREIDNTLAEGGILGTIQLPKNLNILKDKLPKPHYEVINKLSKSNPNNKSAFLPEVRKNSVSMENGLSDYYGQEQVSDKKYKKSVKRGEHSVSPARLQPLVEEEPEIVQPVKLPEIRRVGELPDIRRGAAPIRKLPPRMKLSQEVRETNELAENSELRRKLIEKQLHEKQMLEKQVLEKHIMEKQNQAGEYNSPYYQREYGIRDSQIPYNERIKERIRRNKAKFEPESPEILRKQQIIQEYIRMGNKYGERAPPTKVYIPRQQDVNPYNVVIINQPQIIVRPSWWG